MKLHRQEELRRNLRGRCLTVLALLAPMALSAPAIADHGTGRSPSYDSSYPSRDTFYETINRTLYGGEIIDLRQVLRLGREVDGRRVLSILVTAESDGYRNSEIELLVNGRVVDSGRRLGHRMETVLLQPEVSLDTLGYDIRTLDLRARGSVYVQSVSLQLDRGYGGYPGYPGEPGYGDGRGELVMERLYEHHTGRNMIPVRKRLNLDGRFRGREVEYVVLRASSARGGGRAELVVNGVREGIERRLGVRDEEVIFMLDGSRNELGHDIRSLKIELQGNITVTGLGVMLREDFTGRPGRPHRPDRPGNDFCRRYPNDPDCQVIPGRPGHPGMDHRNEVSVRVGQHHSNGSLDLERLLGLDRGFRGRELESVEVVLTAAQGSGQARLLVDGRVEGGTQSIGSQLRTHVFRLSGVNNRIGVTIRDLRLELRGRVYVESVTARLGNTHRRY